VPSYHLPIYEEVEITVNRPRKKIGKKRTESKNTRSAAQITKQV